MKLKLTLTTLTLILTSSAAFADCSNAYKKAYETKSQHLDQTTALEESYGLIGATTGLVMGAGAVGLIFPALSAPTSTQSYSAFHQVEKAYNLLQDALAGNGVVLKEFAQDTGLTREQAVAFIRQANSSEVLCSETQVMAYDDIVSLAKRN